MTRIRALAFGAAASAFVALPLAASAQDAPATAAPPVVKAAKGTARPAIKPRRRKPVAASPAAPSAAANGYQLVPTNTSGSALSRARQNAFGTPDEEPGPSRGPRRIGIGLGGANGTTPGMAIGF